MPAPPVSNVAVLGAGLIGLDLVDKIRRSPRLRCGLVVGHDRPTVALRRAAELGCPTTTGGASALTAAGPFDVVFDATTAAAHTRHYPDLAQAARLVVDLTPSGLGTAVVPAVNGPAALTEAHLNLISCGGQASIPVLHAITRHWRPDYIEVVTTVASATAGRATRLNLDEYITTTQAAIRHFTGAAAVKVLVNVSPARPAPPFRVAMTLHGAALNTAHAQTAAAQAAEHVQHFAPGFTITSTTANGRGLTVAAEVTARGGRLPHHAGNLHLINAAAVLLAEQYTTAQGR
ncbi:acetaldehyde dehydrogenase (acetylating) [Streptomyces sp. NPDC047829]|uniref:acetaldehyde dehydrogenase (acetylating) n=1 Tax=Streptomyces sp. NPDC047829 TaxID=3154609 RepID=UPI0033D65F2E